MKFAERLKKIDFHDLENFLLEQNSSVYESTIYNRYFGRTTNLQELTLFRNHFCLFHALYKIQEKLHSTKKHLHINFMRIQIFDFPQEGQCQHFIDSEQRFCAEKCNSNQIFCESHLAEFNKNRPVDSLRFFYLDESNYDYFTPEIFQAFQKSSFEIIRNYKTFQKSLDLMNLKDNTDLQELKSRFRSLAKKYHPDLSDFHRSKFIEINNAYHFLKKIYSEFER